MYSKYIKSAMKYLLTSIAFVCALVLVGGCQNSSRKEITLTEQIENLKQDNKQLQNQVVQFETENEQLKHQLQVLSGLSEKGKLENIYDLRRIKITRYTNIYDKDKDGKKETLIVYIQPIDSVGDIIKACGAVEVELWDLNSPQASEALLGRWKVEPSELKKLWFATLLTVNYRLTFDVSDKVHEFTEPLTVKVTFTDYLAGKVFKEQKAIKPQPD